MDDRVEDMDLVTARRSSQMSTSRRESGTESPANILLLKKDLVTNKDNDKKVGQNKLQTFYEMGDGADAGFAFSWEKWIIFCAGILWEIWKMQIAKVLNDDLSHKSIFAKNKI